MLADFASLQYIQIVFLPMHQNSMQLKFEQIETGDCNTFLLLLGWPIPPSVQTIPDFCEQLINQSKSFFADV